MYAVIRTGNKQYRVEAGMEVLVEKLNTAKAGETIPITDVLMYSDDNELQVGNPVLPVTVHCLCVGHEKGPKLRTLKYKRRKTHRKTIGHRQELTRLRVDKFERREN